MLDSAKLRDLNHLINLVQHFSKPHLCLLGMLLALVTQVPTEQQGINLHQLNLSRAGIHHSHSIFQQFTVPGMWKMSVDALE